MRISRRPFLLLAALFVVVVWPHIVRNSTLYNADELDYYYPAIRYLAPKWPWVNPCAAPEMSAAGPMLTYLLAGLPNVVLAHLTLVKLAASLFSLGVLYVAFRYYSIAAGSEWVGLIVALPILCSQCFQISAVWLMTDNLALLFALPAFFDPFIRLSRKPTATFLAAMSASAATATRQIYVWAGAPLALFSLAWSAGFRGRGTAAIVARTPEATVSPRDALYYRLGAVLAILGPCLVLLVLFGQWGGLVPPQWRKATGRPNPAAIPFALGLLGLYGVSLGTVIRPDLRELARSRAFVPTVLGTLALWLLIPNDLNVGAMRCQGMLWWLVGMGPSIHARSLVLLALVPMGGLVLLNFFLRAREEGDTFRIGALYAGLAAWIVVQSSTTQVFQRYFDVLLLACLGLLTCLYGRWRESRHWWLGPAALSAVTLLLTNLRFLRGM